MKKKLLFSAIIMACIMLLTDRAYAQAPDWTPTPGLQYNMQIVGRLQLIDNSYSDDANDLVGAFVDDVSRGVASPTGIDPLDRVYLTIGSNALSGDTITLQAYIAVEDTIYAVELYEDDGLTLVADLIFNSGTTLGTYLDPYIFRLSDNSHTVTFDITPAAGAGGFVDVNGTEYDDTETIAVIDGNDLIMTFIPDSVSGYHVQTVAFGATNVFDFSTDEALLQPNGTFIDTLANVTTDSTVTVVFALNQYTLNYTAGLNGELISGIDTIPTGDTLSQVVVHLADADTVLANPAANYIFYLWSDGSSVNPRIDVDVTSNLDVTALFVPDTWTPGSNYQYSMTIVGELIINGAASLNEFDLVAAFVNDTCRGIASPNPDFDGLVFLNIGSNDGSSEEVELFILDSETGTICPAGGAITFVSNLQLGTLNNPYLIACEVDLEMDYGVGFTWFSANVDIGSWDVADYFADANVDPDPQTEDRIIGQTSFALHTAGGTWVGGLTEIDPEKMYRFRIPTGGNVAKTLTVSGAPVSITPINLFAGFTWLGYLPQDTLNVNDALDDLTPAPTADDRIVGQTSFAIYNGTSWIGSLSNMYPGRGYIIKLANASTLTYPSPAVTSMKSSTPQVKETVSPIGLYPAANMKNTMTVLGKLELNAQEYSLNENDVVYAFIDGEVRGMAAPTANDGLIFMNIGDNNEEAKPVHFKVWIDNMQQLFDVQGSLAYEALGEAGSLNEPYIFKLDASNTSAGVRTIGQPYPNPFNNETMIPFTLGEAGQVELEVYNSMGQLVKSLRESKSSAGSHNITLNRENLQSGMYFYVIRVDNNQQTGTLMVK